MDKYEKHTQCFDLLRRNVTVDQIAALFSVKQYDGILMKSNGGVFDANSKKI